MSETPTYDRLCAERDRLIAEARAADAPISARAYRLLRELSGKAITSGQRAGERAAHNVYDAHCAKHGTVAAFPASVRERASSMARIASARAREQYAVKLVREGRA
jgi:hypothetical protein